MPREREAALPGRGKPVVERACVKRTRLRERAVYLAYQTDCLPCSLREQCLDPGATGNRARRVSAVRRLLPPPASVERKPVKLGPIRWVDVAGRALRRTWTAHWRSQYVEVLALAEASKNALPPPRPPRAVGRHHRWSWHDRACSVMRGQDLRNGVSLLLAFLLFSP